MSSRSPREVQAKAISLPNGVLPMFDAADPNDRALKSATICDCVVSVGYLAHNRINLLRFLGWDYDAPEQKTKTLFRRCKTFLTSSMRGGALCGLLLLPEDGDGRGNAKGVLSYYNSPIVAEPD